MLDLSVQLTLLLTCWGSAASVEESDEEDAAARHNESADEDDVADEGVRPEKKIGAKKLAKLQRKEEAKQIRQVLRPILAWCGLVLKVSVLLTWRSPVCCVVRCAALRCALHCVALFQAEEERRAQRKAREEQEEAERLKRKQDEKEQERLEREDEERRKKEREERELEEFNKWKSSIEVEAEGSAKAEQEEKKAKLAFFADHVKKEKVVLLEDLAITFSLQTQEVIDELTKAEDEGRLTGVIDERGKYIYISPEEMDSVVRCLVFLFFFPSSSSLLLLPLVHAQPRDLTPTLTPTPDLGQVHQIPRPSVHQGNCCGKQQAHQDAARADGRRGRRRC